LSVSLPPVLKTAEADVEVAESRQEEPEEEEVAEEEDGFS
jgi:hypothetical protein